VISFFEGDRFGAWSYVIEFDSDLVLQFMKLCQTGLKFRSHAINIIITFQIVRKYADIGEY
jgi:hypothetical protein